MQTTGRAITKTETSTYCQSLHKILAAVQHFFAVDFVILLQAFYFNIIRSKISYFAPSLPSENQCEVWGYKTTIFPRISRKFRV